MRVEAIKDNDLKKIKKYLSSHKDKRRYCLFVIGTNTGLRISDIVGLKVKDIKNEKYLSVLEQKTNKRRKIIINNEIKSMLEEHYFNSNTNDYLFPSQKGGHVGEVQAWRWFKEARKKCRIKYNIGTHSMRKTLGTKAIEANKIEVVQKLLGHRDQNHTLQYLGLEQEVLDDAIMSLKW